MQNIAKNRPKSQVTLQVSKQAHQKYIELLDTSREFPTINELIAKDEQLLSDENTETTFEQDDPMVSIWIPFEGPETKAMSEKVELKLDQQLVIDDIAQTLASTEYNAKESKAILNLTIGGEGVIVQIVKRRNRTKVQFTSENSSVRRLLKNTKIDLKDAAEKAGLNLERIEVR